MNKATTLNQPGTIRGLTLIELIVAIAIAAVLMTMAVPSIQEILRNNQVSSQGNELTALINLARNEAIRRNVDGINRRSVVVLNANANEWTGNVTVTEGEAAPGCPPGVIRCASHSGVLLSTTTATGELSFDNRGYLIEGQSAWVEQFVCLRHQSCSEGQRQHRQIRILPSGQVESEPLSCNASCGGVDQS